MVYNVPKVEFAIIIYLPFSFTSKSSSEYHLKVKINLNQHQRTRLSTQINAPLFSKQIYSVDLKC